MIADPQGAIFKKIKFHVFQFFFLRNESLFRILPLINFARCGATSSDLPDINKRRKKKYNKWCQLKLFRYRFYSEGKKKNSQRCQQRSVLKT